MIRNSVGILATLGVLFVIGQMTYSQEEDIWAIKNAKVREAKDLYDLTVKKAKAIFEENVDREQLALTKNIRSARMELIKSLEEALDEALESKNLQQANKISAAKKAMEEELRSDGAPVERGSKPEERTSKAEKTMKADLVGKWKLQWSHDFPDQTWIINADGSMRHVEDNHGGRLVFRNGETLILYDGRFAGAVNRITKSGPRLVVEQWAHTRKYDPNDKPSYWGTATRIK